MELDAARKADALNHLALVAEALRQRVVELESGSDELSWKTELTTAIRLLEQEVARWNLQLSEANEKITLTCERKQGRDSRERGSAGPA